MPSAVTECTLCYRAVGNPLGPARGEHCTALKCFINIVPTKFPVTWLKLSSAPLYIVSSPQATENTKIWKTRDWQTLDQMCKGENREERFVSIGKL